MDMKVEEINNKCQKQKMEIKTIMSITEARKKIFKIAKDVQKPSRHYILTEKGRPKAVIMSAEEFESWQETLEVMREFPDLDKDVKKIDKAVKGGEHKKWMTLEDLLAKEGFVVADKSSKKYEASNKVRASSKKRTK